MASSVYKKELVGVLREMAKDQAVFEAFLADLLTPGEYDEIAKRWQIVKQLAKETPHRKIAKDLRVGVATITRGARELLDAEGGFMQALKVCKRKPNIC
ncbi:MAG: Trp family transcriptional regulator [bacterium]|nr:Trp family transcriptional regulator [bacterium]